MSWANAVKGSKAIPTKSDTGPVPKSDTGPVPKSDTGPVPKSDTGPVPKSDTGPVPKSDTEPLAFLMEKAILNCVAARKCGPNPTYQRPWQLANTGKPCQLGHKCSDMFCTFDHKNDCANKWRCDVPECTKRHLPECMFGHYCTWDMCLLAHQTDIYPQRWQQPSNQ